MHGTLQVVHRDFFDEDNTHAIPSASLEDVFEELSENYDVTLKWLIVETDIINVDHHPNDDFERLAAKALKEGKPNYESVEESRYRFAGPIRLASQCLKCHVKHRTDTNARTAGLTISMPLE
ncbi:signal peptide protein [Rhodopirellula sp. SWK7]|nr:signal peptide protein [Rhodopirellula sp. SWK7]